MIHMLLRRRVVGVLLAGMLLAAVLVPVGAGAQSDGDGDGVVSGVVVCSDVVGSFWVGWEAPVLVPSDFRVSWAVEGLGFLSWRDDDEVGRGNVYPGGGESSLMVEGLEPGAVVQVRLRARYFDDGGVRLWSGPWSELVSGVVAVEPVESDGCGHDDEESVEESTGESTGESVEEIVEEIVEVSSRENTEEQTDENIENIENIAEQSDENGEGSGEGTDEGVVAVGSVLAGVMSLGGGSSSGSTFAGYSSPVRAGDPPRVGGFEMSFIDGVVMRRAYQLFALAQIRGEVASGPAAGLSDPVALTMLTGVDLSGGFRVEAGDVWLSSVDAEVLGGVVNAAGYRYWLWDAPCVDWQSGDVFDFALVAGEGAADDLVFTDGLLRSVGFDGATLDSVFDPMETSHVATADADAVSVTVNVAAAAQACDVVVTPADADPVVEGHQVVLGEDGAIVGVTVTAADNATTVTHTLLVGRGGSVPAGASKMSLRGVGDIDFEPLKLRYDTIVPSGVTSTVVEATSAGDTVLERFTITAGDTEFTAVGDDGQVTLTAGRDTLVAVRAATPNNERQSVYTMRLQAPRTPSQPDRVPKSMGRTWESTGLTWVLGTVSDAWGAGTVSDAARYVQRTTEPLLSGLTINSGTLTPVFAATTFDYTATVAHDTSQITVTPAAADGVTVVIISPDADSEADGHQVALNAAVPGGKPAQTAIVITADSAGRIADYTLTVTREAPAAGAVPRNAVDAVLSGLTVDAGTLFPLFSSSVKRYAVFTTADDVSVAITATAAAEVTITYQGPSDTMPSSSNTVTLVDGRNDISVIATNTDSETTTYTLTVIRIPAAATDHTGFLQIDTGWDHVCGLRMDNTLSCKTNRNINDWTFVGNVPEGTFEGIGVKRFEACGTRTNGELYCWTRWNTGVLQTGVDTERPVASAQSGTDRCALLADGTIGCFPGVNNQVITGPFTAAASARDAVCGLQTDGKIRCWTTGSPWAISSTQPQNINIQPMDTAYPDTVFKFVAAGYNQACGIRTSDAAALCWRWDYVPNGYALNRGVRPITTTEGAYKFVDGGIWDNGCGVLTDGTVNCWDGPSSNAPGEDSIGYESVTIEWAKLVCGLRTDRSMRCWNVGSPPALDPESPWRDNSKLLGLGLEDTAGTNDITLSGRFDRNTVDYTATVLNAVASVKVVPELTNSLARYTVYSDVGGEAGGDDTVALAVGENTIKVRVVSADRTSDTTYTVTITRGS